MRNRCRGSDRTFFLLLAFSVYLLTACTDIAMKKQQKATDNNRPLLEAMLTN